jgi:hypothetical protein
MSGGDRKMRMRGARAHDASGKRLLNAMRDTEHMVVERRGAEEARSLM